MDSEILTAIIAAAVALATSLIAIPAGFSLQKHRIRNELQKEYEQRLNERKWPIYAQFVSRGLEFYRVTSRLSVKDAPLFAVDMNDAFAQLLLVGSDDVLLMTERWTLSMNELLDIAERAYSKEISQEEYLELIRKTEDRMHFTRVVDAMRRDLGLSDSSIAGDVIKALVVSVLYFEVRLN